MKQRMCRIGLLALVLLAGCIAPETAVIERGSDSATDAAGVRLYASFEWRVGVEDEEPPEPGRRLKIDAWAENGSPRPHYTRGFCYTPWSWTLHKDGSEVLHQPPQANCEPISWADFPPGGNLSKSFNWNGTIWEPAGGSSGEGRYEDGGEGRYRATVQFAYYPEKDSERFCCPSLLEVSYEFAWD